MKITKEWLEGKGACAGGKEWFLAQDENDAVKVLKKLMTEDRFDWANWTICRMFNRKQRIKYAVFAAEQVLDIFEKKYPNDKRPRLAIEAARKCIDKNTKENRRAAAYAACASYAASDAAYAASDAADAASDAACAADAARAADAAAYAACAADAACASDAVCAADAADNAADNAAAKKEMQKRIMEYGIKLLEVG